MPYYPQILYFSVYIIAWYMMSAYGYAAYPDHVLRIFILIFNSGILLVSAFNTFKHGHKKSALITGAYALCCWIFYGECMLLSLESSPSWTHAVTVYNMLRYFLMAAVFVILLRDFFRSIKSSD